MPASARHEAVLTAHALRGLGRIPGGHVFRDGDPARATERLGVIPFGVDGISHFLVAAILGYEFGIGVRSGCFRGHPCVLRLVGLNGARAKAVRERILAGDRREMPGMTRVSFGLYNTIGEVDQFHEALAAVAGGKQRGHYTQDRATGEYRPHGWAPRFRHRVPAHSATAGKS